MEPYRFSQRPCPVCRSERSKLLFTQSFAHLPGANLLDGYRVVICEDCGAGFADDIPTQDDVRSTTTGIYRNTRPPAVRKSRRWWNRASGLSRN